MLILDAMLMPREANAVASNVKAVVSLLLLLVANLFDQKDTIFKWTGFHCLEDVLSSFQSPMVQVVQSPSLNPCVFASAVFLSPPRLRAA